MRADCIDSVRHSSQNPASWSDSISQVKSQSSLMQMAGETASERTASGSLFNTVVAFDFHERGELRTPLCRGEAHVRTPEKSPEHIVTCEETAVVDEIRNPAS